MKARSLEPSPDDLALPAQLVRQAVSRILDAEHHHSQIDADNVRADPVLSWIESVAETVPAISFGILLLECLCRRNAFLRRHLHPCDGAGRRNRAIVVSPAGSAKP